MSRHFASALRWRIAAACFFLTALGGFGATRAEDINFSRQVLPILSDRCFHCHGPDEENREAELRLDLRDSVVEDRGGYFAVAPGEPGKSELLSRVLSDDPDLRMPPPDSHRKELTKREIEILRRWIESGASWGKHWAFEKPQRTETPESANPIDWRVSQRLAADGLKLTPPATKETLARRVALDLTGMPPSAEQLQRYLEDESPRAYERLVEQLLASPHYGERMAMWWLDAARYSDTDGYQQDATRNNWPWRDWVIQSFNANKPFDEFTIEQFAGDLLPNATPEQKLATAFHRNHMTNGEGGRDPEESRIDYVMDRVNTTGSVWLGLTLGCAQCHSHKFDPITQKDYYRLFAFFNSIDEDGKAGRGAKPYLKYTSKLAQASVDEAQRVFERRKKTEAAVRSEAEAEFGDWLKAQLERVDSGFEPWRVLSPTAVKSVEGTQLTVEADHSVQSSGPAPHQDDYWFTASSDLSRITGLRLEVLPHESHTKGKLSRGPTGEFILTDVKLQVRRRGESQVRDIEINNAIADTEKSAKGRNYGNVRDTLDDDPRNGWTTEGHNGKEPHYAVFALAEPLVLADDEELVFVLLHRSTRGKANIGRFRIYATDQRGDALKSLRPMPLEELAAAKVDSIDGVKEPLRKRLLAQFLTDHEPYQQAKRELDRAQRQLSSTKRATAPQSVMVLAERKEPRVSHVLIRGVWDKKGEVVRPGPPLAILARDPKSESAEASQDRMQLARWLVSPENPLTARVVVNQLWQLCFGAGLVRTPEDFGLQGELPTHPELLDWLASELIESKWDIKHVMRLIVTSETYRQSSVASPAMLERDPDNRLLARGARFRMPSWMIRDAALQASGLLNPRIGGPPVMPYQPPGVWAEMFMGRFRYEPSQGPTQHRRTVYAFWRRAAAPTFLFDSAQRRVCEVRPRRTNTPLHALTLLNDLSLLESARALGRKAMEEAEGDEERIKHLFRTVVFRDPNDRERQVLLRQLERARNYYREHEGDAKELLDFGQPEQRDLADDRPELSAFLVVASMILNLDEAITHE